MQTLHRENDLRDRCPPMSGPAQVQVIKIPIYAQTLDALHDLDIAVFGSFLTG